MKPKLRALIPAFLAILASPVLAQSSSPQELVERSIHRRAVEAVIWGMPLVNYDRLLQAVTQSGGAPNQILYWSQPVNWKNQTLTPNPDTIYLNPFYDTRKGPVVLEVPPAGDDGIVVGSVDTAWQNALGDIGPTGLDQGKGGKYLITPPGYKDKIPEGYFALPSDTYQGFVILRSNFKSRGKEDIAAAVAHGKKAKMYPLGGDPASTVYLDVYDKPFDSTIPYDLSFFESLHRVIQVEPWLERDKVMIEMLKTIGIEKGKPFTPDAATKALLESAVKEAKALIGLKYEAGFEPPFFADTHWAVPIPKDTIDGMSGMFADPNTYAFDGRAVMYSIAYFSAKQLGTAQFYLLSIKDKNGRPLAADKTYLLNVPANAPVKQYWSATAYDRETHALIKETSHSSRSSNVPELQKNGDGSVDLFFGPAAPPGKESNWVPTGGRDFEIIFRLYGPEKAFFEKKWPLTDLQEVRMRTIEPKQK